MARQFFNGGNPQSQGPSFSALPHFLPPAEQARLANRGGGGPDPGMDEAWAREQQAMRTRATGPQQNRSDWTKEFGGAPQMPQQFQNQPEHMIPDRMYFIYLLI